MAHFASYNTDDPNASASGYNVLGANGTITLGPIQTDRAQKIRGSVFADQAGTIYIEQSFDGIHWDISASYPVTASAGSGFEEDIIAPAIQVRYVNGSSAQGHFRLFARTLTTGN